MKKYTIFKLVLKNHNIPLWSDCAFKEMWAYFYLCVKMPASCILFYSGWLKVIPVGAFLELSKVDLKHFGLEIRLENIEMCLSCNIDYSWTLILGFTMVFFSLLLSKDSNTHTHTHVCARVHHFTVFKLQICFSCWDLMPYHSLC